MGEIKKARVDVLETLEQHGIKAISYDTQRIIPPVAIVVPGETYIGTPARDQTMKHWNLNLSILLIASKGTANRNADELDDLIEKTLVILEETEVDIKSVSGPGKVNLSGSEYMGSIIAIEHQIKLDENI